MKHLPLRECGCAIGFIVAVIVLYGAAYFAMMERVDLASSFGSGKQVYPNSMPVAFYRFADESSRTIFRPAHCLDRLIRPDLWENEYELTHSEFVSVAKPVAGSTQEEHP
jgi:hypothetical protein